MTLARFGAAASIINSAYLCFVNLEALFGLRDSTAQVANFVSVFGLAVVTLTGLFALSMVRLVLASDASSGSRIASLVGLGFAFLLVAPFVLVGLRILGRSPDLQLQMIPFMAFELVSVIYLVQIDRTAIAKRRIMVLLSWLGTLLVAMIVTGIHAEWLGGPELEGDLRLVYGAILFHLLNASLIFYGVTVARAKRLRHEQAAAERRQIANAGPPTHH